MTLAINNKVYRTYEDFPSEDLYLYAGMDCIATSGLLSKLHQSITERPSYRKFSFSGGVKKSITTVRAPSVTDVMERYGNQFFEFIVDLEINGIKYDIPQNKEMGRRMVEEIGVLEDRLRPITGISLNFDSGPEVSNFLYNVKGYPVLDRTKTNEPSVDGDALISLAKHTGDVWLKDLAKHGDIVSVYRTFIRDYADEFVKRDGRIHPTYNLHGTSSFRISGELPNLTQLPRPKHGYNVRDCFVVDEGNVFIALDFSSAEVKVLGALCKDKNLLKAIEEGLDFHSFSASQMHSIPYEEFVGVLNDENHQLYKMYKGLRQVAKVLTFSILYGSTAGGIANQLGISLEEAKRLIDLYFNAYPGIRDYILGIHEEAKANGFIITPFGRRKMEFGVLPPFSKTAVFNGSLRNAQNMKVQSTTSDAGLFAFSTVNEQIKKFGAKSLCTVYDSLEIECPIEKASEVLETAFHYMDDYLVEAFDWLDLPIGVEAEIGTSWGNVKKVHRGIKYNEIVNLLGELHV